MCNNFPKQFSTDQVEVGYDRVQYMEKFEVTVLLVFIVLRACVPMNSLRFNSQASRDLIIVYCWVSGLHIMVGLHECGFSFVAYYAK